MSPGGWVLIGFLIGACVAFSWWMALLTESMSDDEDYD